MTPANSNWLHEIRTEYKTNVEEVFLKKLRLRELSQITVQKCTDGCDRATQFVIEELDNGKKHYLTKVFAKEIKKAYHRKDFALLEFHADRSKLNSFVARAGYVSANEKSAKKKPAKKITLRQPCKKAAPVRYSSEESDCSDDETECSSVYSVYSDGEESTCTEEETVYTEESDDTKEEPVQKFAKKIIIIEDDDVPMDEDDIFTFGDENDDAKSEATMDVDYGPVTFMDDDVVAANYRNKRKEVPSDEETPVQVSKKPRLY